jgi:hypothetical protein
MMQSKRTKAGIGAALIIAALTLQGCVVTARPAYEGGAVVTVAPPAPQVELIGVAPQAGFVWFPGYWNWEGGRHVWHGGYWGAGRPGYHWVAHRWVQGARGGWHLEQGHWAR